MNGQCGDNVTFNYNSTTMVLTIQGTGPMYDWQDYGDNQVPWSAYRYDIVGVDIKPGGTTIGNYAFNDFKSLVTNPDLWPPTARTVPGI